MRRALASALLLAAACGGGGYSTTTPGLLPTTPIVHVLAATITPAPDDDAMVSFSAHNAGGETDTLLEASCECARSAEVVGVGAIDPQETGMFGPNGDHVLLRGFDEDLTVGDFADVTLVFANAGEVVAPAEIEKA